MKRYVTERAIYLLVVIFAVIIVNFTIIHLVPGDPVTLMAGEYAPPEYIESTKRKLGLDRSLIEQLYFYILSVIRGDLGFSFYYNQPVLSLIFERLGATLLLMGVSIIISVAIGVLFGVLSSRKQYTFVDNSITAVSLILYSLPTYWLGLMLMLVFSVRLGWLPAQGMYSVRTPMTGLALVFDILRHLIIPAAVTGAWHIALITRLTRANMLDVLHRDFIKTALSKGLSETRLLFKHALPNAISPIITILGMSGGKLFAGAILAETITGWPGIGILTYKALLLRDYPLLMGIFIFTSVMVAVSNLMADVMYAIIDPRVRYR